MLSLFAQADLEQQISSLGLRSVLIASVILTVCTLIAIKVKGKARKRLKKPLFLTMAGSIVISAVILFSSTVYLNVSSESGGPVHWHSDIEFWVCGSEIDLRNPQSALSNKIGTSTFHEHNDKRIHLEGVVVKKSEDASLEKFMRVTGGYISAESLGLPMNPQEADWLASADHDKLDGDQQRQLSSHYMEDKMKSTNDGPVLELRNGMSCDGVPAKVQTFVFTFDKANKTYSQRKLENPAGYVMRDEPVVPPADCVIVEFDTPKARTNKLCQQYGVRDEARCTQFGVERFNPHLCNIHEVSTSGGSD